MDDRRRHVRVGPDRWLLGHTISGRQSRSPRRCRPPSPPRARPWDRTTACAADQGAYWRYHDSLILNQTGPTSFVDDRLKQMAAELGLDTAAFNSCLDSGEKRAAVEASIAEGREQGVDSPPTVFINGVEFEVGHDWNAVQQAIESAIAAG